MNWNYICTLLIDIPVREMIEFVTTLPDIIEEETMYESSGDCNFDFIFRQNLFSFHYQNKKYDFYCRHKHCNKKITIELLEEMVRVIRIVYPNISSVLKFKKTE